MLLFYFCPTGYLNVYLSANKRKGLLQSNLKGNYFQISAIVPWYWVMVQAEQADNFNKIKYLVLLEL